MKRLSFLIITNTVNTARVCCFSCYLLLVRDLVKCTFNEKVNVTYLGVRTKKWNSRKS
jgi:hypothetical protein